MFLFSHIFLKAYGTPIYNFSSIMHPEVINVIYWYIRLFCDLEHYKLVIFIKVGVMTSQEISGTI
jgi:hypothetical protein